MSVVIILSSDGGSGPLSNETAIHSFALDNKRSPPDQLGGHSSSPFDERRSMQPIGTERLNKKARTQATSETTGFIPESVLHQHQQQQQQQQPQFNGFVSYRAQLPPSEKPPDAYLSSNSRILLAAGHLYIDRTAAVG